ncbi:unnamed protein product [Notodromas monacha]|uniref:GDP-D-glucose phosphorylase 1 n=1 Tax=Notodromas monacha TaxID=399045 RepID=A0A7R9GA23_9CRUS|nr:unnamed protein product [Notodromas monacha]CAG0913549.1 unnamed protein product [Notodromas monacha]
MEKIEPVPDFEWIFSDSDLCSLRAEDEGVLSDFDESLMERWHKSLSKNVLRFRPPGSHAWKNLGSQYGFYVMLNPGRMMNRRTPKIFQTTKDPLDPNEFNFNKIKSDEVLMTLVYRKAEKATILVNLSPFVISSSLLVPSLPKLLPQVLNEEAIDAALTVLHLSRAPNLRIAYNSMCAYASVNHLHFHMFYDDMPSYLGNVVLKRLTNDCYVLEEYPAPAFVFISEGTQIQSTVQYIMVLVRWLLENDIAHNVFITRGSNPNGSDELVGRCYVWARESYFGSKEGARFFPAVLELAGRIIVYEESVFQSITEEEIAARLAEVVSPIFGRIRDHIASVFEKLQVSSQR